MHQESVRLDIRENFFTERFVNIGTHFPGKWLSHCPWRYLKDEKRTLRDMAWCWTWPFLVKLRLNLMILVIFSNLDVSMIVPF